MDNQALQDALRSRFPKLKPDQLAGVANVGKLKAFASGEAVVRAGQFFGSVVFVLEGRLKLYQEGPDGNELMVYYLEPGAICALSVVGQGKQETADLKALALEPSQVLLVPHSLLDRALLNDRAWFDLVLENYRNRFRDLLQVVDGIAFKNMDERLTFYLQRKTKALTTNILVITHEEIANDLNSSRAVVSRLLKQMEHQGLVRLHRNSIEVLK